MGHLPRGAGVGPSTAVASAGRLFGLAASSVAAIVGAARARRRPGGLRSRAAGRRRRLGRAAALQATEAGGDRDRAGGDFDAWMRRQLAAAEGRPRLDAELARQGAEALQAEASPARHLEPWRYTDLRALLGDAPPALAEAPASAASVAALLEEGGDAAGAPGRRARLVFVDGVLVDELSSTGGAAEAGCLVGGGAALASSSADARARIGDLLRPLPEKDIFPVSTKDSLGCLKLAALNQATLEDCACVLCPDAADVAAAEELLVEIVFVSTGRVAAACTSPRVVLHAGQRRKLRVVESHLSAGGSDASLSNGVCRVLLAEGAQVRHDLLQQRSPAARFVESVTAEVAAGAEYELRLVQTGSRVARVNAAVALQGKSASCKVTGIMLANDKQQLDLHSLIHHSVPGCASEQLHKNIVADSAECIMKGSIRVDRAAQQTDSRQLCRTLLLTKRAKVKAMPSLQIQADDVTCSHGAAVTELDKKEVFYIQSRGLDEAGAKKLLLVAFPQDLLGDLGATAPRAHQRVVDKLVQMADA